MSTTLDALRSPSLHRDPVGVDTTVLCPDPDCSAAAQVVDAWTWASTDGPVPHARTRCQLGHVFTPPADWLVAVDA